ncbi:hypothetical protein NPIL_403181 [Nephila pilipes]|uniref:Uncharacterized protein n=1 Tax=Nephila pilipes TaxID=299642 RepID=A0A8X6PXK4_NEPPI|nr:hypothetical protein NPIL_403181 [Nephila pilipes]
MPATTVLCRHRDTIVFEALCGLEMVTCSCLSAEQTDFFGLPMNAPRTLSTFSSLALSRPSPFLSNTEPVIMKLVCRSWMLGLDSQSPLNLVRKFR